MSETKRCGKCERVLPRSEFHISWRKPNGTVVYRTYCKKCNYTQGKAWAKYHPDEIKASHKKVIERHKERYENGETDIPVRRRCAKCGHVKTSDLFYAQRQAADGLQAYCIACLQEYVREWKSRHA